MRIHCGFPIVILFSLPFFIGASRSEDKANEKVENKSEKIDGVFVTSQGIAGFSGTVLELKNGKFRYWFYSDVGQPEETKFPLTGDFKIQGKNLSLSNPKVNQIAWEIATINNRLVLLRDDAADAWKSGKLYDYGILIKVDGIKSADEKYDHPSINVLRKEPKEWKDPFVHGPQDK